MIGNGKQVFVVHGRNQKATDALFDWLRRVGLEPLEWIQAEEKTESGSPDTLGVIKAGFDSAQAFVVLFTDDEEVRLREELREEGETDSFQYQSRPNVLFEGGMAYALDSRRTVFVELGAVRRFSDLSGINTVRLGTRPTSKTLKKLIGRLKNAGCVVNETGDSWMNTDGFESGLLPKQ